MTATKTLAFQIPEELDDRVKKYLAIGKEAHLGKSAVSGSSSSG